MTSRFFPLALSLAFILAACAGPDDAKIAPDPESPMPEIADDALREAAPVTADTDCADPGDGIGGTGCTVD